MCIRFDTTDERVRQADAQTQTPHDDIGRAYASHRAANSRPKNAVRPSSNVNKCFKS